MRGEREEKARHVTQTRHPPFMVIHAVATVILDSFKANDYQIATHDGIIDRQLHAQKPVNSTNLCHFLCLKMFNKSPSVSYDDDHSLYENSVPKEKDMSHYTKQTVHTWGNDKTFTAIAPGEKYIYEITFVPEVEVSNDVLIR